MAASTSCQTEAAEHLDLKCIACMNRQTRHRSDLGLISAPKRLNESTLWDSQIISFACLQHGLRRFQRCDAEQLPPPNRIAQRVH
jgi:hypothetical protein